MPVGQNLTSFVLLLIVSLAQNQWVKSRAA